jgi:hypothetical protein
MASRWETSVNLESTTLSRTALRFATLHNYFDMAESQTRREGKNNLPSYE